MDLKTARALCALTTDFYKRVHASFDATRQSPWPGWERLADITKLTERQELCVLDFACGNLRFERYLATQLSVLRVYAVDSCDALVHQGMASLATDAPACDVSFQHLDILDLLLNGGNLSAALEAPLGDLTVCFGFMHHVPLPDMRSALLRALVEHTRPSGHIALAFWQFAQDERLRAKARPVEGGDTGDYLLGWQDEEGAARYCHSFTEAEVDDLARSIQDLAEGVARYSADGKSGTLNRYLVLRRR